MLSVTVALNMYVSPVYPCDGLLSIISGAVASICTVPLFVVIVMYDVSFVTPTYRVTAEVPEESFAVKFITAKEPELVTFP